MSLFHFGKPLDQVTLKDCQNLIERLKIQCLSAHERTKIWNDWTSFLEFDCSQEVLLKLERTISVELHSPETPSTPELEHIIQQQTQTRQEIQEHINSQPEQQALLTEVNNLEKQIKTLERRIKEVQQESQNLPKSNENSDSPPHTTQRSFTDCLQQYQTLQQSPATKKEWQNLLDALKTLQGQKEYLEHEEADWAQKAEETLGIAGEDLFALKNMYFELQQTSQRCQQELPGFEPSARYYLLSSSLQPLQVALQQWQAQAGRTEIEVQNIREQATKIEDENQRLQLYLDLVTSVHELKRTVS